MNNAQCEDVSQAIQFGQSRLYFQELENFGIALKFKLNSGK